MFKGQLGTHQLLHKWTLIILPWRPWLCRASLASYCVLCLDIFAPLPVSRPSHPLGNHLTRSELETFVRDCLWELLRVSEDILATLVLYQFLSYDWWDHQTTTSPGATLFIYGSYFHFHKTCSRLDFSFEKCAIYFYVQYLFAMFMCH